MEKGEIVRIEVCEGWAGLALYVDGTRVAGKRHNGPMKALLAASVPLPSPVTLEADDEGESCVFHYRVDGGPEQILHHPNGLYQHAVAAIAARYSDDVRVEIWCPELLPDYGPYKYVAFRNECGNFEVAVADNDGHPIRLRIPGAVAPYAP